MTAPLDAFMSTLHALEWLDLRDRDDRGAVHAWLEGVFGDPIEIARGEIPVPTGQEIGRRFASIMERVRELIAEERFLNWQVAFSGIWTDWEGDGRTGGFDAVVGNPPWDRMRLEQFGVSPCRVPEPRRIAKRIRAEHRARMQQRAEQRGITLPDTPSLQGVGGPAAARLVRRGNGPGSRLPPLN